MGHVEWQLAVLGPFSQLGGAGSQMGSPELLAASRRGHTLMVGMASSSGVCVERGELIAGRYELIKRLGRGAMGEVWAGRDRVLHRDVAVKMLVIDDGAHVDLPRRFEREAVAAAQIGHPNVVALHDRGVHEDLWFLVMERVEGVNLAEHIRDGGPMALARALQIAQDICSALTAAHQAHVIHYDIKPHNVMITPDGRVKVVDFGIAGFIQSAFTLARSSQLAPAGTPEYGAPEQFLAERGDARSDLYALGSVLFALLAGRPPFMGHSGLAIAQHKSLEDAPRLDALRPNLPPEVTQLVADLLERNPDRRPQTALEVCERLVGLRASLDGTPDIHDAMTATAGPRHVTIPPPIKREPAHGDAFEVAWTGQEPVTDYARPIWQASVSRPLAGISGAIWAADSVALAGAGAFPFGSTGENGVGDGLWGVLGVVWVIAMVGTLVGVAAVAIVIGAKRLHRRMLPNRTPWSLTVAPQGIVTTGSFGRTVTWERIQMVTVDRITSENAAYTYTGLHIRLVQKPKANSVYPAGWFYRNRPDTRWDGTLPLCVLGPLSEQQHSELTTALARHAGSRWRPGNRPPRPPRP
ncbi:serine/threonine-protein kinase [Streptomyces sp. NPDC058548]|uniref:serine/threonine-protein kinase n=1 Tax=Streptomyces sp. NPDC058548 TaxID=3346545 RepID=UPI003667D3C3